MDVTIYLYILCWANYTYKKIGNKSLCIMVVKARREKSKKNYKGNGTEIPLLA